MAQLTSSGIAFGNGELLTKDPCKILVANFGLGLPTLPNSSAGSPYYIWSSESGTPIGARGALYGVVYYSDGKGTWTYSQQSKITVTNFTDTNMRINLVSGVRDSSDDTIQYRVYRGGSQTNATTHSGGTLIYDTGGVAPAGNSGALYSNTMTQDIAANTSVDFWLYAGVLNGSAFDYLRPYLVSTFNAWI